MKGSINANITNFFSLPIGALEKVGWTDVFTLVRLGGPFGERDNCYLPRRRGDAEEKIYGGETGTAETTRFVKTTRLIPSRSNGELKLIRSPTS